MPPSMPTLPSERRRVAVRVMSAAAVAKPLSNRRGDDGETRAAPLGRADVDVVPEQIGGVLDDKEPEAETVRPALIGPLKGAEYRRQGLGGYADAGVTHLDAQLRAKTARGDGHRATGRRVINGVSYEISQHAGQ